VAVTASDDRCGADAHLWRIARRSRFRTRHSLSCRRAYSAAAPIGPERKRHGFCDHGRMSRLWLVVALSLSQAGLLSGCGSTQSPTEGVKAGFAAFFHAAARGDAQGICGHLVPVGEHQSSATWTAQIRAVNTPAGHKQYEAEVAACARDYRRHPDWLRQYKRAAKQALGGTLEHIVIQGNQASATVVGPNGRKTPLHFGNVNGMWAVLFLSA
jgi:hypothetical protein